MQGFLMWLLWVAIVVGVMFVAGYLFINGSRFFV